MVFRLANVIPISGGQPISATQFFENHSGEQPVSEEYDDIRQYFKGLEPTGWWNNYRTRSRYLPEHILATGRGEDPEQHLPPGMTLDEDNIPRDPALDKRLKRMTREISRNIGNTRDADKDLSPRGTTQAHPDPAQGAGEKSGDDAHQHERQPVMRLIKAEARVAVTGTPLQNGLHDFSSLLNFLRIPPPFDDMDLLRSCFTAKRREGKLAQSTKRVNALNDGIVAAIRSAFTIRRTKVQDLNGKQILGLKRPIEVICETSLDEEGQAFQEQTRHIWDRDRRKEIQEAKKRRDLDVSVETASGDQTLRLITEARLHVVHPELINARYGEFGSDDEVYDRDLVSRELEEVLGTVKDMPAARSDENLRDITIATSREKFNADLSRQQQEILNTQRKKFLTYFENTTDAWKSYRLWAIVCKLEQLVNTRKQEAASFADESQRREYLARHKILVFSEFLSALDVLEFGIIAELGFKPHRFDGTCNMEQREATREAFEEVGKDFEFDTPDPVNILLITSTAGAEDVTLVHASDVIIIGPSWNPFIEEQCVGRSARKGQTGQVSVYRFFTDESMERRLQEIKSEKYLQVSGVLDDELLVQGGAHFEAMSEPDFLSEIGVDRAKTAVSRGSIRA